MFVFDLMINYCMMDLCCPLVYKSNCCHVHLFKKQMYFRNQYYTLKKLIQSLPPGHMRAFCIETNTRSKMADGDAHTHTHQNIFLALIGW